jgi:hypothetical protein
MRRGLGRTLWDFWARPVRAEPLALFRILLGAAGLLSVLGGLAPDLGLYLGRDGLCPPAGLDDWLREGGRFCLLRGPVGLPLLGDVLPAGAADAWRRWGDDPGNAALLLAVWAAALAGVTVGLFTRLSTFVAWALAVTFFWRLPWVINGGDDLFRTGLFYLLLAPSGAAWSLDRLRRRQVPAGPPTVPAWPVRLAQIQICAVYFFTGLVKLVEDGSVGGDWISGEAVYWVLNDVSITRWPYAWLPVPLAVCRLLSWGTLVFEIGFPLFVLSRRLRPWLLAGGVAFHLGILAATEVGWFSPYALCWYALFVPGEALERLARRVAPGKSLGLSPGPKAAARQAP